MLYYFAKTKRSTVQFHRSYSNQSAGILNSYTKCLPGMSTSCSYIYAQEENRVDIGYWVLPKKAEKFCHLRIEVKWSLTTMLDADGVILILCVFLQGL